ncbi:mitochondrial outer membrane translocase complex, subunit Tom22 [Melampsora americana]|nr:mitochondrial outer membrane translocase complex, subunit Tom22 [Melampsora americana]
MVKIEELKIEDSDDGFVTESDNSSESDSSDIVIREKRESDDDEEDEDIDELNEGISIEDETILDRIYALKDIISPSSRATLAESWNKVSNSTKSTTKFLGNVAWVITTSMILVGLPMALSIEGESMLVAHEKEMERQAHGQQSIMGVPAGNAGSSLKSDQPRTGVTPTGF